MYDTVIIGCGPAGMTAGIYLARAGKKVIILEKETIGGAMSTAPLIENYPGFEHITGNELAFDMYNQAQKAGVEIKIEEVEKIEPHKVISDSNEYETKTIILATGTKHRKLNIPNEEELIGKGIHFCASCDGPFYKDKTIAVLGGANSAVVNTIYLANICKKIYLIYRGDKLKCEKVLADKVQNLKNVEILYNTNVVKINGQDKLESIVIKGKTEKELKLDGMFEAIGTIPETKIAKDVLSLTKDNYFQHNNTLTNLENVFVAGDCASKNVRQVATAVSDGATAATFAINYLNK